MKKYTQRQKIIIGISLNLIGISAGVIGFVLYSNAKISPPTNNECVIQECHGPFFSCGEPQNIACTQELRLGDYCEQFATCQQAGDTCVLKKDPRLIKCQECVQECENFQCVERCVQE